MQSNAKITKGKKSQYPRPLNSFMLFKKSVSAEIISSSCPAVESSADVSRIAGTMWKAMSAEERRPFIEEYDRNKSIWKRNRAEESQRLGNTDPSKNQALKTKTKRVSKKELKKRPITPVMVKYAAPASFFSSVDPLTPGEFMRELDSLFANYYSYYNNNVNNCNINVQPSSFENAFDSSAAFSIYNQGPHRRDYLETSFANESISFSNNLEIDNSYRPEDFFTAEFLNSPDDQPKNNCWIDVIPEVEVKKEESDLSYNLICPSPITPSLPCFADFCSM